MRILLCANRDLMANLALNRLRPALSGHSFDIVLSDGVGKKAPKPPEIVEWGSFERDLMEGRLFPFLEQGAGGGESLRSFAQLAESSVSGTTRAFPSINRGDGLAYVTDFDPDVIVSIRFGQIFRQPALSVPRFGTLNLHSGVLPSYRGILATFWAMLNGEERIGCTLHSVEDDTIDTGAVVGIHEVPTRPDRSVAWNVASLYEGGTAMIAAALSRLAAGEAIPTMPQDPGRSAYFSYPDQQRVRDFLGKGGELYTAADYGDILAGFGLSRGAAARLTGFEA